MLIVNVKLNKSKKKFNQRSRLQKKTNYLSYIGKYNNIVGYLVHAITC